MQPWDYNLIIMADFHYLKKLQFHLMSIVSLHFELLFNLINRKYVVHSCQLYFHQSLNKLLHLYSTQRQCPFIIIFLRQLLRLKIELILLSLQIYQIIYLFQFHILIINTDLIIIDFQSNLHFIQFKNFINFIKLAINLKFLFN